MQGTQLDEQSLYSTTNHSQSVLKNLVAHKNSTQADSGFWTDLSAQLTEFSPSHSDLTKSGPADFVGFWRFTLLPLPCPASSELNLC
jgi:hypothetical protein